MAEYVTTKVKRKHLEDVNDEFSDFPLSSPARKSRRLDFEWPMTLEEEERKFPLVFEHPVVPEESHSVDMEQVGASGPVIEELPTMPENDERAIVLFKPMSAPLLQSPSGFSVSVSPDILSGIKNQFLGSSQPNFMISTEDEAAARRGSSTRGNECLAVVPWVSSQFPPTSGTGVIHQSEISDLMESDDMGPASMDIEENKDVAEPGQGCEFSGMGEGLHQWQWQHCMIPPQIPKATSTPISWF